MIPGWRRKPVVKVRLHYVPSETGTRNLMFALGNTWYPQILYFCLPSIHGFKWPNISRSSPVSGDYSPFPCSHPTHNIIHFSDDGNFGKTHHCILKVFCLLQCLRRLHFISQSFTSGYSNILIIRLHCNTLTSLTNQLTGDLWKRKADTTFFHQFHQCSAPDVQKQTNIKTKKVPIKSDYRNISGQTWLQRRSVVSPRWLPETENLLGLIPVHRPM